MIDEMLLEHVTPPLDDIQESLFERFSIDTKPRVKHSSPTKPIHFYVQLLVGVNLEQKNRKVVHHRLNVEPGVAAYVPRYRTVYWWISVWGYL